MSAPRRGDQPSGDRQDPLLVVGVGASAGGLDALEQLLSGVPYGAGLAFVVVQHLDPRHRSMLVELLARHTTMRVVEAADGVTLAPEHVYVLAPGALLTLERGALRLVAAAASSSRSPIDVLLRSLAQDRGERAVGVVLSGGGHDGTAGLRALKERGGLTLAQDPETAAHDGMPRSAIEAGVADHALAPGKMASKILAHARYVEAAASQGTAALESQLPERLREICEVVHRHTGHDFGSYKEGTLLRRIRRRLQVLHVASVAEYLAVLEEDANEAEALVKDLLVGVTQFFRDPDAFRALSDEVVPRIVQARPPDVPVRIWVPGCASGEEVYSIAILVREHLDRVGARRHVQIFGTDLDAEMLGEARQGRYPASIVEQVGADRLARFFVESRQAYEVGKDLRETCIFSQHSLVRDPPFSQLDLVSCRNVLIYLGAELQRKLVPLFHYALRSGGFLFLGPSEGIAQSPELFETFDKKSRIFRRKETVTRPAVEFPLSARAGVPARALPPAQPPPQPGAVQTAREKLTAWFERLVLEEYAHPSALVDERGDIALVAGPLARYLKLPAGTLTSNLLDAVRGALRIELRAALQAASASGRRVVRERVAAEIDDVAHQLRLVVRPLPAPDQGGALYMVVLQERASDEEAIVDDAAPAPHVESPAFQRLEDELRSTRGELRATVEALEATNEELKSSNEELVSTNEELQSANEELQTSQEELQSTNEELETVNAELRRKVEELGTANSDLQNLFASTDIATLFLDRELRIGKFTPAATALFHLRESDVGRPIGDLAPRFVGQDLLTHVREVLLTLTPIEREVRTTQGDRWFILRVLPYRTVEKRTEGVVVTFVDVSHLKRAEGERDRAAQQRQLALDAARLGWWRYDPRTRLASYDERYAEIFGVSGRERPNEELLKLLHPDDLPGVLAAAAAALDPADPKPYSVEYRIHRPDGAVRWIEAHGVATFEGEGAKRRATSFVGTVADVTSRKATEERLAYLASFPGKNPNPIVEADVEGRVRYANPAALRLFPDIREKGAAHPWLAGWEAVARPVGEGRAPSAVREVTIGDRSFDQVLVYAPEERVVRAYALDITERTRAREALERSRQGLSRLAEASLSVMARSDRDEMLQAISEAALVLTGARMATCGHGLVSGQLVVGGSARVPGAPSCPPGDMFQLDKGGVHMALVEGAGSIRLTDAQLRSHERWWGLPESHVPMRGLLGAPMLARDGRVNGMILATDKEAGEFTEEDESLLQQLATVASLALQHVEARVSLEGADRHKNEFLAMLSHELRNPLAPIRNSLYILERATPGGEQARRAQAVIHRQVAHMTRLVDELLDVTRISRGKIQLQRELLDLAEVVRRALEDHRESFAAGGLALEVALPSGPVRIDGDRTRVAQVIDNLLQNAAKFTPHGGTVAVVVEANDRLGHAVARVRDTGSGIAPEMLPRLFQPFTQADTTLDRSKGGLGLGLALVKGLVEMHGGGVSVASEGVGRGAEFTVRLPLAGALAPASAPPPGERRPAPLRRVVVIEDNVDAADSLREVLELAGHAVVVAHSGPAGIERARGFGPDVVLCDIGLPGMDGYDVARRMRADPALRSVTLVALTGYAAPDDVARASDAGFDHHLAKPPSHEQLELVLSRARRAPS